MKKINLLFLAGFFSLNLLAQHNYDNQSAIYSDNGNVAIGTSNPLSLLYLQQTTNDFTGGLRIENSAHGRQFNLFVDGSNNSLINSSSNGSGTLILNSGGGNVGIGTTTPRGSLDVDGPGNIYLVDDPNNNGSQSIYVPGHMFIAPYNGGDIAYVQARRQNSTGSTSMRLRTYDNGQLTDAMHISSEGNVGIGTVTPSSMLHLHQTTNDISGGIKIVNSAQGRQFNLFVDGNNDSRIESSSNGSGELILNSGGGNVGIGTTSPAADLHVDGTSQFDETAYFSSNIGIGVSSPVSTLHLQQAGDNFNGGIKIENSGQTHQLNLFIDGSQRSRLDAASDGSDQLILNLGGGNVGIGTADPDANLAVNGDIHAQEVRVDMIGWPDYVFENDYELRSLEAVEKYIKKNKHLPGIPSEAEVIKNGANLGDMNAKLLQKIEELTLYLIEQNKQLGKQNQEIEALKARIIKSEKQ